MRLLRVLILLAAFAPSALWADLRIVHSPGDGFLNLRTGPGSQFANILEMDHGSTVDVLDVVGKWARVRHASGAEGWAFLDHTRPYPKSTRAIVVSPGDGFLNLRTGPGTGFSIVTRMYNGEWVEVLERQGSWARVRHVSGFEGWASLRYLASSG